MGNFGLQLYSVREAAGTDLLGTMEKVADMGYSAVQFAGFGDHSAVDVKAKLDELGLKVAGAHVGIEALEDENELNKTLTYHETIGNELIIIPGLPENMRTTADDFKRTAELMNLIGEKLYARGFMLGYHNHDFEFKVFDGKTGLDIFFENTDPNHLRMELDCFWAAYTDNDPLDIIEKYGDRCVSLHIKDMKVEGDQPISTELGTGTLPLAEYMKKGNEVGTKWMIVEQEHFTKDPLESAKENAPAIRKLAE